MEKILGQSPAAKNQDENLNVNSVLYDAAVVSSVKNEVSELNNERSKSNLILGDTKVSENCESPTFFKESTEKVSPTIFESAFKVMKTFFSPEKAKNKPSYSVNQHKGVLESSNSSFPLPKEKLIIAEPEIEVHVMKSSLHEENDLKDKKQLTVPVLSPVTLDLQSNNDDSFLTTISYDESFQSAVTHFDENGEVTKTCDNLLCSVFNNSQDLDVIESCNSSLENSECCLENTMLKNDSTSSKEINHNGFSIKNTKGYNDQNKNLDPNNVEGSNANCSYQAPGVQVEVLKANDIGSFTQASNQSIGRISDLNDEFSAVNGSLSELDFCSSKINFEETVLQKGNQIPDQIKGPGLQQLSLPCSSNNADCLKKVQEKKVSCTNCINLDFVEMENSETDEKIISTEKSDLQIRFESPTPHLSNSDLNEVDEMLLALKSDSGTIPSMNSSNRNYAIFTGTADSCFKKSSDFIYSDQKSVSIKENVKPDRSVSPVSSRSDKSKGIFHKCVDENDAFMEAEPSFVLSLNKGTEDLVDSRTHDQNQQKLDNSSNCNMNHKIVSTSDNEELNFEKNVSSPTPIPPKNCTALCLDERPVVSPYRIPVSNSLSVSPLTATNTEVVENNDGPETGKLFVGEAENRFSLKHSTPVSVLHNNNSVCSSNQKLNMNSLEINEGSDSKINSDIHNASSDFLSKAMGIFFEPSNPSISAESISSGSLMISPKPSMEFSGSPVLETELNKSGTITQILKDKSESPTSSRINLACELNSSSKGQKETSEEKLELPKCDQILDKKSESFDSEKSNLNKTVEVREPMKLNKIKNLDVSNIAHKSNDKVLVNEGPNALDLTFNIKIDAKSEKKKSRPLNEINDSYRKESNTEKDSECDVNSVNKIPEKSFTGGFISDKERSGLSESQEANNFLSPIKEPPEPMGQTFFISANESLTENIDGNKNTDCFHVNDENHSFLSGSFGLSPSSGNSSLLKNQILASSNQVTETLSGKLKGIHEASQIFSQLQDEQILLSSGEPNTANQETLLSSGLAKNVEPDVAQLIEQEFTPSDIAKICDIANLSESLNIGGIKAIEDETENKEKNVLSPKSFDFLNSIQGKPTGRDLSRESLYVKFDPLVQPSAANSLIDFTKEVEALEASETSPAQHSSSICEELLAISPEKKSDAIVPPLTPLSDRNKKDKVERQKELQNEIYFLKNLYSERERINKAKMEEYESQIAKLTGDRCVLEDKLKEYVEREKSIVKKMTAQTRDIEQLKIVMKEYVKVISMLTAEIETMRKENAKEIETLTAEKESYMNHLLNTEAAFSDVHTKYEKSKKMIESLKVNEILYRNTISEHAQKMEEYKKKAKEAQQKAVGEFQDIMAELQESKNSHSQEVSRLRAQLKKTELKLEALQESLEQKIKENQQLTAICDELIEGKK